MATFAEGVLRSPAAVGRAVKLRRESLGLTQQQLAGRGLTNRYAVMKLEDGDATKAMQTMFDLLYALDLELVVRRKPEPGEQ